MSGYVWPPGKTGPDPFKMEGKMTTNETIARWLGKDIHIGPTRDLRDGDLYRFGDAEGICIVHVTDDESHSFVGWNPEEYIEDWHGEDGLLAEIGRQELAVRFETALCDATQRASIIGLLRATPSQLAAALVEVIGEK